uniref:Uncharacterized protein n=1 Tax=Cannabis sativa TaxID=3483 RepID=A0A803PR80_CANSA
MAFFTEGELPLSKRLLGFCIFVKLGFASDARESWERVKVLVNLFSRGTTRLAFNTPTRSSLPIVACEGIFPIANEGHVEFDSGLLAFAREGSCQIKIEVEASHSKLFKSTGGLSRSQRVDWPDMSYSKYAWVLRELQDYRHQSSPLSLLGKRCRPLFLAMPLASEPLTSGRISADLARENLTIDLGPAFRISLIDGRWITRAVCSLTCTCGALPCHWKPLALARHLAFVPRTGKDHGSRMLSVPSPCMDVSFAEALSKS